MDAVNATAGQRVRVAIRVEPNAFLTSAYQVHVQGLPRGVRFAKGTFVAPDRWVIPAADLGALELAVGETVEGRFELATELRGADGQALAEAKAVLVVAAPPVSLGDSDRLDEQNQDKFLTQGLRLLVTGNISSARLLFQRAADAGNARAALLLGDTYDSDRLAQLGVQGLLPDRDKAIYWYERADELGAPEAKERIAEVISR